MKKFLLVFEDLLQAHVAHPGINEPRTRTIEAPSKEGLIQRFGLLKRQKDPRICYWDGKNNGILIFIHEICDKGIDSREELNELVQYLFCEFY